MLSNIGNILLFLNILLGISIIYLSLQNLKSSKVLISKIILVFICLLRLVVRTPGFHPGSRGSIPLEVANFSSKTPSFSGLGHLTLTQETGVRLPSGSPTWGRQGGRHFYWLPARRLFLLLPSELLKYLAVLERSMTQ